MTSLVDFVEELSIRVRERLVCIDKVTPAVLRAVVLEEYQAMLPIDIVVTRSLEDPTMFEVSIAKQLEIVFKTTGG